MLDFIRHFAALAANTGAWSQVKVDSSHRSRLRRFMLDALEGIGPLGSPSLRATVTVPTVLQIRQAVAA